MERLKFVLSRRDAFGPKVHLGRSAVVRGVIQHAHEQL
jgi:hypothetical protein